MDHDGPRTRLTDRPRGSTDTQTGEGAPAGTPSPVTYTDQRRRRFLAAARRSARLPLEEEAADSVPSAEL